MKIEVVWMEGQLDGRTVGWKELVLDTNSRIP